MEVDLNQRISQKEETNYETGLELTLYSGNTSAIYVPRYDCVKVYFIKSLRQTATSSRFQIQFLNMQLTQFCPNNRDALIRNSR